MKKMDNNLLIKIYNFFIKTDIFIICILLILTIINPVFFPRLYSVLLVFIVTVGQIGLIIDKIQFKKKNKIERGDYYEGRKYFNDR